MNERSRYGGTKERRDGGTGVRGSAEGRFVVCCGGGGGGGTAGGGGVGGDGGGGGTYCGENGDGGNDK